LDIERETISVGSELEKNATSHEERRELLNTWISRTRRMQWCHYAAENHLRSMYLRIGIPSMILSGLAGALAGAGSADLGGQLRATFAVAISLFSVTAGILTTLQTFLKFDDRAVKHGNAARLYGAINLKIQTRLVTGVPISVEAVESLGKELADTDAEVLAVPARIWA